MKALNALRMAERSILVVLFLTMVALYFSGVVTREIGGTFASQFAWVEEAVRLMNLFLVFLALGLALERGKHVGIDTLRARLPERTQRIVIRGIDAVGCLFSLFLVLLGGRMVQFVLGTGQTSPTLGIPMGYIYLAPAVGFGLLALRYALSLFGVIDRIAGDQRDDRDFG